MDAVAKGLQMLGLRAPVARLARMLGKADAATVSRRHARRMPEMPQPILDGDGCHLEDRLISVNELIRWLSAKADAVIGTGEGYIKFHNAGEVSGYWNTIAHLQHDLTASVDTRRMAETGTGSGRSPSGAVGEAETPNPLRSQRETHDH